LLISIGYISLGIVLFGLCVKFFAVLPGGIMDWHCMSKLFNERRRALLAKKETPWHESLLIR
jgi:hypothetical protein